MIGRCGHHDTLVGSEVGGRAGGLRSALFVHFDMSLGGAEWVITNLCNGFVAEGVDVTLITSGEGALLRRLAPAVRVERMTGGLVARLGRLRRNLERDRYSVVMATERTTSSLLSLAHLLSGSTARLVIREAASNFAESLRQTSLLKRVAFRCLYTYSYRRADLLIANSEGTRDSLSANRLVGRRGALVVIDNPVDIQNVREGSLEEACVAPPAQGERRIVTVARLDREKRVQDVVLALERLRARGWPVSLVIVGEGPERGALEALIQEKGLEGSAMLTGRLQNPYPILRSADVFVLASEFEGFGMVIVEALALGVPVVATDLACGWRRIFDGDQYGRVFAVGDIEALVAHVAYFLGNRPDRETLAGRAMEFDASVGVRKYMHHMGLGEGGSG